MTASDACLTTLPMTGKHSVHSCTLAKLVFQSPSVPTPPHANSVICWITHAFERFWYFGPNGSIDEMTMGFQGRCYFKQRITYKVEGDGFQCDALCDAGYTYSWWFRVMDPPKIVPATVKGISPLHQRMFWLLSRLDAHACFTNADGVRVKCECESNRFKHTFKTPFCRFDDEHECTRVYMDNLYLSVRIAELARNPSMPWPKTLVAGPARTNRGIPDCCLQVREKTEKKAAEKKGIKLLLVVISCVALFTTTLPCTC